MKEFVFAVNDSRGVCNPKAPWMATAAAVIIGGAFFGVFCGLGLERLNDSSQQRIRNHSPASSEIHW